MSRKDDHIRYALEQPLKQNDFDRVRFVHQSLPDIALDDINMSTTIGPFNLRVPLMINAMTGGSLKAKAINKKLAMIAKALDIPLATGSVSAALKDSSLSSTYTVIRDIYPKGLVFANIGAGSPIKKAQAAVDLLQADALQIHLNAPQELVMPEGDRDFTTWKNDITSACKNLSVPLIVKEVGFGMSKETLQYLKTCGVTIVDISGYGGTNFIDVENKRRKEAMTYLNTHGLSTVESLLEARKAPGLDLIASGGIRNPLDAVKALALGANLVGLSGYFLHLVVDYDIDVAIDKTKAFIEEMKIIMTMLGVKTVKALTTVPLIFDYTLQNYITQRQLN